jgi:hypothetical protein
MEDTKNIYPLYKVTTNRGEKYDTKSVSLNNDGTSSFVDMHTKVSFREIVVHVETVPTEPLHILKMPNKLIH